MKDTIDAGLVAFKGFYDVINTKEKFIVLIIVWMLAGLTYTGQRFATVEAVEKLMITYAECVFKMETGREWSKKDGIQEVMQVSKTDKG